ncbi:MAG: hypothetical protein KKH88_00900 [Nanoarchaeota archaeon]|nr:hypothetical protein [Nanoarchaeota archaeon]
MTNRIGRMAITSALVLALAAGAVGLVSCGNEYKDKKAKAWAEIAAQNQANGELGLALQHYKFAEAADEGDQYVTELSGVRLAIKEANEKTSQAEPVDANPEFSARYDIAGVVDGYLMLTAGTTERESGMWGIAEQIYCTTNNIAFGDVDFGTSEVKKEVARIFGGMIRSNMGMEGQRAKPKGDGFRLMANQAYRVPEEVLR